MSYFWQTKQVEIFCINFGPDGKIGQLSIVRQESETYVNWSWWKSSFWKSKMDDYAKTGLLFFVGYGGFISMVLMVVLIPKSIAIFIILSCKFLNKLIIRVGKSLMFWVFSVIVIISWLFGVQMKAIYPLLLESIALSVLITTTIIPLILLAKLFYDDSFYDVIDSIFDEMEKYFPENYENVSIAVMVLMACKYY